LRPDTSPEKSKSQHGFEAR